MEGHKGFLQMLTRRIESRVRISAEKSLKNRLLVARTGREQISVCMSFIVFGKRR